MFYQLKIFFLFLTEDLTRHFITILMVVYFT